MTDTVSKATRSKMMSAIRGKDTKPEMIVRKYLHSQGFRYRLHDRKLPGKPDLVLKKYNVVIFVNGCFWHRHNNCKFASKPSTNPSFWQEKFNKTIARDTKNIAELHTLGWRTVIVWECSLKNSKLLHSLELTKKAITKQSIQQHIEL